MIDNHIGFVIGMLIYALIYLGSYYLISIGIFDTEHYEVQYRLYRYIRKTGENEITCDFRFISECVEYKKKWWKPYRIEPLPDKLIFDSEETKKLWFVFKESEG